MADVKISALPAATTPLAGTEVLPIVQGGATDQVSVANLTAGRVVAAAGLTVDANSASAAVRITQTGAGNALVVEDSDNPDSTPFVVTADGNVGIGTSSPNVKLDVIGTSTGVQVTGTTGNADFYLKTSGSVGTYSGLYFSSTSAFGIGAVVYDYGANNLILRTNSTDRVFINSSGNVGIGTSAPATTLDVATGFIQLSSGSAARSKIYADASVSYFTAEGARALSLDTNGQARLRIADNGFSTISGSFGRGAPVTKTGNFTLGVTENWIICNGTGSITVTLPAASSWTGREVMIKTIAAQTVVSASSNVVPLAGGAAGTAILAAAAGNWATLVSDGTNWIIMQG